ncbi:hypothetical protein [Sphingopyxis sp. BSNA05]|uniref:hypothetical protein n=1 Tax=Sphingopyxis sp. BSNA05 TaxID=1236614 RepID=UPI0020B7AB2C|nr:hypothetical protein [Sphingopyxis sp. BSNA05]
MNIGGTKVGVMDKDQHRFDYEIVRPGVYKVVIQEVLEEGEYGFIYALNGGATGGAHFRFHCLLDSRLHRPKKEPAGAWFAERALVVAGPLRFG